jgi:multidrug resistance efflux pump
VGDIVQSGDLIAVLDSTTIQSEIAKAEADLELAKAELEKSKLGSHPALIKEAESKVELARAERPIGVEEESAKIANVNSALARLEYLKSLPIPEDIKLAEAEVDRREVALEAARLSLNQTFLISPIEGNVVKIFIKEYEYAGIGEPIVRISNLKNLQVDVVVDSFEIGNIKLGDNATIRFDVIPNLEILGEVIFIKPEDLDRMSGNFIVTLSLPDQPEEISLGMMAYVNFSE